MDDLVSTEWLATELGAKDLRIVDASLFLDARDARAEFEAAHVPGALFLDLDSLRDTDSPLPNTWPQPHRVASRMQALGIGDASRIVFYDNSPTRSAARAWWLVKAYGAPHVAILDGGLQKWVAEGRPTEAGPSPRGHGHFTPHLDAGRIVDKGFMLANLDTATHQVADARSKGRFDGVEPDPHGTPSGHIPGSICLHYPRLLASDGTYKDAAGLKAAFDEAGIDLGRPLVATCGSGVTAAIIAFAALRLGKTDVAIYDGSWSEWGSDPDTPKASTETA